MVVKVLSGIDVICHNSIGHLHQPTAHAHDAQVWVGVLPVGPGGVALNSTFQKRDTPQYKSDLGLAIASLAGTCPDGLLVFFPSYGVLQSCIDFWKSTSGSGRTTY